MNSSRSQNDRGDSIAAIVLTFDAPERLAHCLRAVASQSVAPDIVYVVNNGSPSLARRAVDEAQRSFPAVCFELVQSPVNSGPAGGHFIGMQHALDAGYGRLWVMDDDIVAERACLAELASVCHAVDEPMIAWPEQATASGNVQNYPGWYGFLVNRAAIDRAGLPDRRLVWWIEDTEYLFHRLPTLGVRSERVVAARVVHGDGRPENEKPPWKIFYETRNVLWYRIYVQRLRRWRSLVRTIGSLGRSAIRSSQRRTACRAFVAGALNGLQGNLDHRWPLPPQELEDMEDGSPLPRLAAFVMTYRRDDRAVEHVEALLAQSVRPERVVVIDNGRSPELQTRLARFGTAVEYRQMPWNTGPAGAAAAGLLELAGSAEWIYWGDDDQPPAAGAFAVQLALADSSGADVVAARGWNWSRSRGALVRADPSLVAGDAMLIDAAGGGMTLLVRSSALRCGGLPVTELFWGYEDIEYVLRLRRAGRAIVAPIRQRTSSRRKGRAMALETAALPRTYYTVRNSVYMVVHLHRRPSVGLRMSGRALAAAIRSFSHGSRYGFRALRLTTVAIVDGWLGLLGSPIPLRSPDLPEDTCS